MKFFYFLFKAIAYIPLKIIFPVKVHNKKAFPKHKKIILISNHLKWVDPLIIAVNLPGFRHMLGKKELSKNIFMRFFAKLIGVIFVERGKSDLASMRTVISVLKKGNSLIIFPEGTRNKNDTNLQEIKSGTVMFSVRGDAPLVPIYIDRKARAFKRTNIYVGEMFELVDKDKGTLNSAIIKEKVEIITQKMQEAKDKMEEIHNQRQLRNKTKNNEIHEESQ